MNLRPLLYALGTLALASSLTACGRGVLGGLPQPTLPPPCVLPTGVQAQLIYPIPGATNVPDATQQVVFAVSSPLPTWGAAFEFAGLAGLGGPFTTISVGQVPTPSATPSFANPVYVSSAIAFSLPASTAIGVDLNDLSSSCIPVVAGSFTTY